jgi:hypothetical protein
MKNLALILFNILLIGFATTAMANKDQSTILHCGCAWDGQNASMEYGENTISSRGRGHDGHVFGSMESCYNGQELINDVYVDVYTDFLRISSDCQLDGLSVGYPIDACVTQEEVDEDPTDKIDYAPAAGDLCGIDEA